jgi:hypothetical protein
VAPRQLGHLSHDRRAGVRPGEMKLADASIDRADEPLLEVRDDGGILVPGHQLAGLTIRAQHGDDAVRRHLVQAHRALVGSARHVAPLHAGLIEQLQHGRGGVVLPAVRAVVEVRVDDGGLLGSRHRHHAQHGARGQPGDASEARPHGPNYTKGSDPDCKRSAASRRYSGGRVTPGRFAERPLSDGVRP